MIKPKKSQIKNYQKRKDGHESSTIKQKKRRSKIIIEEDSDKTKSNDISQFKVARNKVPKIIYEIVYSIRETRGLGAFRHFKCPTLNEEYKFILEEAIIDTIYKFKHVPI